MMVNEQHKAKLCLLAYDEPTHTAGNAQAYVTVENGHTVVAWAGTNDGKDLLEDLWLLPWRPSLLQGRWVHKGFWNYFQKLWPKIKTEIYINNLPVILLGHSLGGAAASYNAALLSLWGHPVKELTTFGTPRCMSPAMIDLIKDVDGKRYRHKGDPIPYLGLFGYTRRDETLIECQDHSGFDHPLQGYIDALE